MQIRRFLSPITNVIFYCYEFDDVVATHALQQNSIYKSLCFRLLKRTVNN